MSDTSSTFLLRARGLRKEYGKASGLVRAVDGVDLDVAQAAMRDGVFVDETRLTGGTDGTASRLGALAGLES